MSDEYTTIYNPGLLLLTNSKKELLLEARRHIFSLIPGGGVCPCPENIKQSNKYQEVGFVPVPKTHKQRNKYREVGFVPVPKTQNKVTNTGRWGSSLSRRHRNKATNTGRWGSSPSQKHRNKGTNTGRWGLSPSRRHKNKATNTRRWGSSPSQRHKNNDKKESKQRRCAVKTYPARKSTAPVLGSIEAWSGLGWNNHRNIPNVKELGFTKSDLNKAIGQYPQLKHCQMIYGCDSNNFGIHFQNHWGEGVQTVAYLATKTGTKVKKPPTEKHWWEGICSCPPSIQQIVPLHKYPSNVVNLLDIDSTCAQKRKWSGEIEVSSTSPNLCRNDVK